MGSSLAIRLSRTYSTIVTSSWRLTIWTWPNLTSHWPGRYSEGNFYLCHVPGKEVHQFVHDALSRLCENHMLSNESKKPASGLLGLYVVGHWGLQKCREFLNDPTITDRTITQFIRQCPCCQVRSRLKIFIKTHSFTCAYYNPFESLHIDHIGPLKVDDKGHSHILVIIEHCILTCYNNSNGFVVRSIRLLDYKLHCNWFPWEC